ncbi:tetratricopeptide repeat protein [Rubrimonas cliftonensis]|uniref:protein O-GlcNAc transferase n=1 Tax=Rubrimonas cliftonensis TaxID=89524 RepID=A0A1H4G9C2_9RHOB|nr:tetratricopeptide repeat protein [Rubrimonas cliftonensis]SEB05292.1 Predicted O-linked N-acetylglucosamine transferase, SPINDLY family [Rubrimonas cliftonensis]
MSKINVPQTLIKAQALASKGEGDQARALFEKVLEAFPANERARKGLRKLIEGRAKPGDVDPPQPILDALNRLYGDSQHAMLESRLAPLLTSHPRSATLWNLQGVNQAAMERWRAAETAFRKVVDLAPNYAGGHNNLGNALHALGEDEAAAVSYERAVRLDPADAGSHVNLAHTLVCLQRVEEAMERYRCALDLAPDNPDAWNGLGVHAYETSDTATAERCFRRACEINPASADYTINFGLSLLRLNRHGEAIAVLECASTLRPMSANQHGKLAEAFETLRRRTEAIKHHRLALAIDPDKQNIRTHYYHQMLQICDWSEFDEMQKLAPSLGVREEAVDPFGMLSVEDAPRRQMLRSQVYARAHVEVRAPDPWLPRKVPAQARGRLRLGYFAGDAFGHATMHLMSGVFRNHDRSAFEVTVFSYPSASLAHERDRFLRPEDAIVDIRGKSRSEAVALARSAELDIAIDLKGYTQEARLGDLAQRVAPVQVHHLAYPSSLGASFIDYIVADHVLIPPEWRDCYSESVIYMPHTYQCTDNARLLSPKVTTRADFGLPEDALVFCCFNKGYKISPQEFDIWMRLLQKLPGSVLWLLRDNEWCDGNLRREARARGVDPARLVFATTLRQGEHLARHAHADLFLDTFNVNAHTTTSDALWAGLPVVTKIGDQFAARVAASLLCAVGLPELVTRSAQEYEALILELALNPDLLASFRARLAVNRLVEPLFDTARYTADFEAGLKAAAARSADGLPPADIDVATAAATATVDA